MNKILLISTLIILASCATPTPYEAAPEGGYGYTYIKSEQERGAHAAMFTGNKDTRAQAAQAYATLAALDYCEKENQVSIILETKNFSRDQLVNTVTPITYKSGNTYQTTSVPTTVNHHIPIFGAIFTCRSSMKTIQGVVGTSSVAPTLVQPFMKDFRGGVLVDIIKGASEVKKDDVLVVVNGQRVETTGQLALSLEDHEKASVSVKVIRKNKLQSFMATVIDNIETLKNEAIAQRAKACERLSAEEAAVACK